MINLCILGVLDVSEDLKNLFIFESTAWERHRPVSVSPEEGQKEDQRTGATLLWRQNKKKKYYLP